MVFLVIGSLCLLTASCSSDDDTKPESTDTGNDERTVQEFLHSKKWVSGQKTLYINRDATGWFCKKNSKGEITETIYFTYETDTTPLRLNVTDEYGNTYIIGGQSSSSLSTTTSKLSCQAQGSTKTMEGIFSAQELDDDDTSTKASMAAGYLNDILWVYHPEESGLHGTGELDLYGSGEVKIAYKALANDYVAPWADYPIGYVSIPADITSIGHKAFKDKRVSYIAIGRDGTDHLASIKDYAFYGHELTSFSLPSTVSEVGDYAFYSDYAVDETTSRLTLGNLVKIGDYAFYNNMLNNAYKKRQNNPSSLKIPETCQQIGTHAFKAYTDKIYIYENLTKLAPGAIVVTSTGGDLYFKHNTVNLSSPLLIDEQGNNVQSQWTLHVPLGTKTFFENTYPWNTFGAISADLYLSGAK